MLGEKALLKRLSPQLKHASILFLIVWIFFGLTINKSDLKAYSLQYAGVEAIVEYKTFQLGFSKVPNLKPKGDVFQYEGKTLAAKQPGQFVLGGFTILPIIKLWNYF